MLNMNILEQEDLVKGLPDNQLLRLAKMPEGPIPQYMYVSEVQRRTDMRKRFAANQPQQNMSVADQVVQEGIGSVQPTMMAEGGRTPFTAKYSNGGFTGYFDEGVKYLQGMGNRIIGRNQPTAEEIAAASDVTFFDQATDTFRQIPQSIINKITDDYPNFAGLSMSEIAEQLTPEALSYYENEDYVVQQGSGQENVERMMPDGTLEVVPEAEQRVVPEAQQKTVLGFDLPKESMVPVDQARFGLGASPGGISFAANLSDVARENPLQTGIGLLSSFIPGFAGARAGTRAGTGSNLLTRGSMSVDDIAFQNARLVNAARLPRPRNLSPQGFRFNPNNVNVTSRALVPTRTASTKPIIGGNQANQLGTAAGIAGLGTLIADATQDDSLVGEGTGSDVPAIDQGFVDLENLVEEDLANFKNITKTDGSVRNAFTEDAKKKKKDETDKAFDLLGERLAASQANTEGFDKTTMGLILAQLGAGIAQGDVAGGLQAAGKVAMADKQKREDREFTRTEKELDREVQREYHKLRRDEFGMKKLADGAGKLRRDVIADERIKTFEVNNLDLKISDPDAYQAKLSQLQQRIAEQIVSQAPAAYGGVGVLKLVDFTMGAPTGGINWSDMG